MEGPNTDHDIDLMKDWFLVVDRAGGTVTAYDEITLQPVFSGNYIAPEVYGNIDPRMWSVEQFEALMYEHGPRGGSSLDGVNFTLGEIFVLNPRFSLIAPSADEGAYGMDLKGALAFARDCYREFIRGLEEGRWPQIQDACPGDAQGRL